MVGRPRMNGSSDAGAGWDADTNGISPGDAPDEALSSQLEAGEPGVAILRVRGDIDAATADEFHEMLAATPTDTRTIWLDLTGVTLFSAAGCGVLAQFVDDRADHEQSIRLVPSDGVRLVLSICGLGYLLG